MVFGAESAEISTRVHGFTPLSHLGQSWTNLGHLGQMACNNTINMLGFASVNITSILCSSDDVW